MITIVTFLQAGVMFLLLAGWELKANVNQSISITANGLNAILWMAQGGNMITSNNYKSSQCKLYRHYNMYGELLYVGISLDAINRLSQHSKSAHWFKNITTVKIENFNNRKNAMIAEKIAIKNEQPLYNVIHSNMAQFKSMPWIYNPSNVDLCDLLEHDLLNDDAAISWMYFILQKESQLYAESIRLYLPFLGIDDYEGLRRLQLVAIVRVADIVLLNKDEEKFSYAANAWLRRSQREIKKQKD